ncbi:hypothetical protein ACFYTQ_28100 [Nocardia sp. NPDC004068]|uniref:hypothetical protein n=1 Tax=Nocardia sp. NPDC004068 TaxID=3364303 RepID=UPI0036C47A9D
MYEKVIGRLDESYTVLSTGQRVTRLREHEFTVVPMHECPYPAFGTICAECAAERQIDFEFDDPFPFARVPRSDRWTIRDLIDAGQLAVGDETVIVGLTGLVVAHVTASAGLLLPDGRVFDNPTAATLAVRGQ